jgi:tetratricopeptide (TPR) repeat protein
LWAITPAELARALAKWGARAGQPEKLRQAVEVFRAALVALKPFPDSWALAQIALAYALVNLSNWEAPDEHLEQAVSEYEFALNTELTLERDPNLWSIAQYNCGLALSLLGERQTGTVMFERAETAFRQALTIWDSGPEHDSAIRALAHVIKRIKDRRSGLS